MRSLNPKTSPRENILDVARNVFSRFGFSKTTMNDIAESARRGRRTIYSHFNSKEDIYRAVIQKEVQMFQNRLIAIVKEKLNPRTKLEKYLTIRMQTISELSNYYDALKNTLSQNYKLVESIRYKFDIEEIKMISNILKEGENENVFSIHNVDNTAKTMVLALKSLEIPVYFDNKDFAIQNPIDNILNILFHGILKK